VSTAPTGRSPDLKRLEEEGCKLLLLPGLLVVQKVWALNKSRQPVHGTLILPLTMKGASTARPTHHTGWWAGEKPCDRDGRPLCNLIAGSDGYDVGHGMVANLMVCIKPPNREFFDHHEMVMTYLRVISAPAVALDPSLAITSTCGSTKAEDSSVFQYADTASARLGLGGLNRRLAEPVAIIGVGGTGSFVLDLVSKTDATAIHLFDGDTFEQHNAFRAPSAASVNDIEARPRKVDYFASLYSRIHRRIIPHRQHLARANLHMLDGIGFVFLCIDDAEAKKPILRHLEKRNIDFVDAGIGVEALPGGDGLAGMVRVTTSTERLRSHVREKERIPLTSARGPDVYRSNIQTAELNALAATLAVLRWKRLRGFYLDQLGEHFSAYSIDSNHMVSDDMPPDPTG